MRSDMVSAALVVRHVNDGHAELIVQLLDLVLHMLAQLLVSAPSGSSISTSTGSSRASQRHTLLLPA